MATNKKPATSIRCAGMRATIWENTGKQGPFFAATFARLLKDEAGG